MIDKQPATIPLRLLLYHTLGNDNNWESFLHEFEIGKYSRTQQLNSKKKVTFVKMVATSSNTRLKPDDRLAPVTFRYLLRSPDERKSSAASTSGVFNFGYSAKMRVESKVNDT